jgi:hypothetical protein
MSYTLFEEENRPGINPENEIYRIPLEKYKDTYAQYPGQINLSTQLGSFLYRIASDDREPKIWFEIGAWNGLGTTTCVLDGFAEREDKNVVLYSLEADPVFYELAKHNLKSHPTRENLVLVYGKSGEGVFPSPEELSEEDKKNRHFELYFDYERVFWQRAPCFSYPQLPEVAILDGGEYSGYLDWINLPKQNLQYVILDDINCLKNKRVFEELSSSSDWTPFKVNTKERNGFAIFRKN